VRGEKLPQPIVRRLWREGLIEASEVTHMESTEDEYLPTFVTRRGQKMLEET
jgi:hypothetical protein